jgi:hypothetical protein
VVENVLKEPRMENKSYEKPPQPRLAKWMFDEDRWLKQRRGIEKFHPIYAQYLQPNIWKYPGKSKPPVFELGLVISQF